MATYNKLLQATALTGMVLMILIVSAAPVFGQDSLNMSRVGRLQEWWEYATDLLVDGDYLYLLTEGPGLVIYDISNPSAPHVMSASYRPGWQGGLAKDGNYLLTTGAFAGVQLFDVSVASSPVPLLQRNAISGYRTPAFEYPYIYIDRQNGLDTYDISDLAHPLLTNSFRRGYSGYYAGVTRYQGILFNWSEYRSLYLLSLANPAAPILLPDSVGRRVRACAIGDQRLYTIGTELEGQRVSVFDLSDPAHPVLGGMLPTVPYNSEIAALGYRAAVVGGSEIAVINAENLTTPFYETVFPDVGYSQITLNDHLIFSAASHSLSITDITNVNSPELLFTDTLGRISSIWGMRWPNVLVEERYPFRYAVVNVSNANLPRLVGRVPFQRSSEIVLHGDYLYSVLDDIFSHRLRVYDAVDLLFPVLIDSTVISTAEYGHSDIAVAGDYLYATCDTTFKIFEYSTAEGIQLVSGLSIPTNRGNLLVDYPIALAGSIIIDISNPLLPTLAGISQVSAGDLFDSSKAVMKNSVLYSPTYYGFDIADFSDPYAPQYFHSAWLDSADRIVGGDERFLYISQYSYYSNRSRVVVLDIQANPHDPQPVAFYPQDTRFAIRHVDALFACDLYSLHALHLDNLVTLDAVTDLTVARGETSNDIVLRWSPVVDANSYKIFVDTDINSLGNLNNLLATTNTNFYTHVNGVHQPGKHYYLVIASTDPAP